LSHSVRHSSQFWSRGLMLFDIDTKSNRICIISMVCRILINFWVIFRHKIFHKTFNSIKFLLILCQFAFNGRQPLLKLAITRGRLDLDQTSFITSTVLSLSFWCGAFLSGPIFYAVFAVLLWLSGDLLEKIGTISDKVFVFKFDDIIVF
jgi:hypothetical protein